MKKKLLILAVAGLALASCSNDETVAVKQSGPEAISFRPLTNGVTRATAKTAFVADDVINVWTTKGTTPTSFFDNVTFTYAAAGYTGFSSNPTYYWPSTIDDSDNKLTFYATYEGVQTAAGQIGAFTPAAASTSQKDLLCSKLEVTSKPVAGEAALAFKHALSQIVVKVKNSNSNLKITASKVKVGYVAQTGALNFTSGAPVWANTNPTNPATNIYSQDASSDMVLTSTATELTGTEAWMILPQNLALSQTAPAMVYTKAYQTTTAGTAASETNLNCAYIALELLFEDATTNATVVAKQWCYWPITTEWLAGKKYTYIIDAAQGGYQPTNIGPDTTTDLDMVLDGKEIRFSTSTSIEAWVIESDINVTMQ